MKTLVIHPNDPSTDFLKAIYNKLSNTTIVTTLNNITKSINDMISNHDRVIMLGHGSTQGLFGVGFNKEYIIDKTHIEELRKKVNNIFIWCNADRFVVNHQLKGLYSGMFISEVSEAQFCGVTPCPQSDVSISNYRFANIFGDYIEDDLLNTFYKLKQEYAKVAKTNNIANYNHERLHFS